MQNKKIALIALILILLFGNIYFIGRLALANNQLKEAQQAISNRQLNDKIFNFTSLFVSKVLQATSEVSFEDRLKLENAVRDLNNQEVLDSWNRFTNSKTPEDAQKEVKNLLGILIKDIKN